MPEPHSDAHTYNKNNNETLPNTQFDAIQKYTSNIIDAHLKFYSNSKVQGWEDVDAGFNELRISDGI